VTFLSRLFASAFAIPPKGAPVSLPKIPADVLQKFLLQPAFYVGVVHGAAVATEEASPDYTWAHKIAAAVEHALGHAEVSTPNAAAAKALGEAILDGVKAAAPDVATAAQASK